MLVPLSWLRDFVPLSDDVDFIVDTFNDLGLVVEGVKRIGEGLDGVIVGHVLDVRAHPNADQVRLADVDLGNGEPVQIGCGGVNLAPGQFVPVATVGAVLPGGFEIGKRKIRGEWSHGMICSEDELGLANERSGGIMVLPEGLTIGMPFAEAMDIQPDVVIDLAIETNRPDAMCIAGVARDIAAKLGLPFTLPDPVVNEGTQKAGELVTVEVDDPQLCSRFTARAITNVTVAPSPALVAQRLTMAGMRPINNVVDASNYVMLELGQPTHPYDLARLDGGGLKARAARNGEVLKTLDGQDRALEARDCVITDGTDTVVGIAGIMGGESSEIGNDTNTVVLEAAVFEPYSINYTSRRLALRTDASARFERRVDREGVIRAQDRFCEILLQSSPGAQVAAGVIDVNNAPAWPSTEETVIVRAARVNAILGTELERDQISALLQPLGFHSKVLDEERLEVLIPSYRPDSEREIDVIEEVARMHGYENIAKRVPTAPMVGRLSDYQWRRRQLKRLLLGLGLTEALTVSLLSPDDFVRAGLQPNAVELVNPIVSEESHLRTSMLPGMLRAIAFNSTRRNTGVRFFEIGHTFLPPTNTLLPDEREWLAIALADDSDDAPAMVRTWNAIIDALNIHGTSITAAAVDGLHPTRTAAIRNADNTVIGHIGEIHPDSTKAYGIDRRVGWLEVDLERLLEMVEATPLMKRISKFPAAEFDLAFVTPNSVVAGDVKATISSAVGDLGEVVELFDVFRSEALGNDVRSLAFRLRIASLERTLSESEVTDVRTRSISAVAEKHSATLRS